MSEIEKINVPEEAFGERLDKFLNQKIKSLSRGKIALMIESSEVLVDGQAKKTSFRLKGGEEITFQIIEKKCLLMPYKRDIPIIYEDEAIIVINKPYGLVVHPPQAGYKKTLVNALLYLGKKLSNIDPDRPGIVHRLDKETSGVMVIAKTDLAHTLLVDQFKERKISKEYRVICWGVCENDEFKVELPLGRDSRNRLQMKISFLNSKPAESRFSVLERFSDSSFLKAKILTGRMHQIRVHLKFLGFTIVGDQKYGKRDNYKEMLLHSFKLGFYHPVSNQFVEFQAPLPERFNSFLKERKPIDV
ncbi:MAG: RluA family pseudouridine synthase [Candidatus Omnitrophica bacterium]|nr:RluA family pseudouridine synthase [Candidatus Omnitrophota bacterium]